MAQADAITAEANAEAAATAGPAAAGGLSVDDAQIDANSLAGDLDTAAAALAAIADASSGAIAVAQTAWMMPRPLLMQPRRLWIRVAVSADNAIRLHTEAGCHI